MLWNAVLKPAPNFRLRYCVHIYEEDEHGAMIHFDNETVVLMLHIQSVYVVVKQGKNFRHAHYLHRLIVAERKMLKKL